MATRLKVLMSAYACEPGRGSEPEVGWQWALQMARFHDVTVLTRANNAAVIQAELDRIKGTRPLPKFVYHDEGSLLLGLKRRLGLTRFYYVNWQASARRLVRTLHERERFDLLHHVTFATYRYRTAIWGHGVPCIWGPIGGIESIPIQLLPWQYPRPLIGEGTRNIGNLLQTATMNVLRHRGLLSSAVLATTRGMQKSFADLGIGASLMPTIGLEQHSIPSRRQVAPQGRLKLLYAGNIIALKGIDLALHALKRSGTHAHLTLVGSGDFLPSAKRLVHRLGIEEQVQFAGKIPRDQLLRLYPDYHVLLFPSLHDTGGYAVLEAMSNQLPVICLDVGGPQVLVEAGCGIRVPLGSRESVIRDLAEAICFYDRQRNSIVEHGEKARTNVLSEFDWDKKGERMDTVYREVCPSEFQRRRVLVSAYACEPGRGSEPEVGLRWASALSRYHDVTVVTRANNQTTISEFLRNQAPPQPNFLYYDLPAPLLAFKKKGLPIHLYYLLWQVGVRWHLRRQLADFDFVHHITFNSFREPGFWWFSPRPVVLGPLGGGQVCPWQFYGFLKGRRIREALRSLSVIASPMFPNLWISFTAASKIIVANEDTERRIPGVFQSKILRLLEAGAPAQVVAEPCRSYVSGTRFLWIGRLEQIKAPELALRALQIALRTNPELQLTMVGGGPLENSLKELTTILNLDTRVIWTGRVPHEEVMDLLASHDAFLFTSLRDTSGNVLLEAMSMGLPSIVLRHQGAAEIATDQTAIRVQPTTIPRAINAFAEAMVQMASLPGLRERLGRAAYQRVRQVFAWEQKAIQANTVYLEIARTWRGHHQKKIRQPRMPDGAEFR